LHHLDAREALLLHLDFDLALLELPVLELLAQLFAGPAPALLRFDVGLDGFGSHVALGRDDEERRFLPSPLSLLPRGGRGGTPPGGGGGGRGGGGGGGQEGGQAGPLPPAVPRRDTRHLRARCAPY